MLYIKPICNKKIHLAHSKNNSCEQKKFPSQIRGEKNQISKNSSDKSYKQKHQRNLGGGGGTITVCNNLVHKTKFETKSQANGTVVQGSTDWRWQCGVEFGSCKQQRSHKLVRR